MLYHGSKIEGLSVLKPNISFECEKLVYATNEFEYALIRSGNFDISNFMIREEHYEGDNYHELCELKPGAFKELFDRKGYIYIVKDKYFEQFREAEFISKTKVPIWNCLVIENILDGLVDNTNVDLIWYGTEKWEKYWKNVKGGLNGYIQRKEESLRKVNEAKAQ